ncbi:MAG: SpoIID/LytB domain-containing protein [Selenomonadales bacterium]|nr:SpoIID/LytB domain-containing protein [Selenomonadales bacterium]
MKFLFLFLGLLVCLMLPEEANAQVSIGWNERHLSARVGAERIAWRDGQGVHALAWPAQETISLRLVAPRVSIATVPAKSTAIYLQRASLHHYPTQIVSIGNRHALALLENDVEILWETETVYVPVKAADSPSRLELTLPGGRVLRLSDHSLRFGGDRQPVRVDGASFRGVIVFNPNRRGLLTSINILPLEEYLLGVVPNEMPAAWPLDALKAQALAARSYAVRQQNRHRHDGFDLCSTVHCQAYHAKGSEHPRSTQAVTATSGMVITYAGAVIDAVYHAHAGGHTRNSEHVWGGVAPYLRGVPIPEEPPLTWTHRVAIGDFERRLRARQINVAHVFGVAIAEHVDAGHVRSVRVTSLLGSVDIPASDLRGALDRAQMRSTKFDILVLDSFRLPFRGTPRLSSFRLETGRLAGAYFNLLPARPASVEIAGSGFGHGVGMSQWGAFGLAQAGVDYQGIIRRFYRGVTLSRVPLNLRE